MYLIGFRNTLCASLLVVASLTAVAAQRPRQKPADPSISTSILLRILRAEDERRWDDNLKSLLSDKDKQVRKRAALAAGRIGDERALPALAELLKGDADNDVRQMAAFAIGEVESPGGADALVDALGYGISRGSGRVGVSVPEVRARAVEALGKIAAALPESDKERKARYGAIILEALSFEAGRRSLPDRMTILLDLTAVLRAKPDGAGSVVTKSLGYADPRIVADALNTMARLRLKDNNEEVRRLLRHSDPIVRANAARVIGAAEDKGAFEALLDRALHDDDLRVRVSAIRALGSLKDQRAAEPLLARGTVLLRKAKLASVDRPSELNELLEIATAIGNLLRDAKSDKGLTLLRGIRAVVKASAPEVEIALARIDPEFYVTEEMKFGVESPASIAQGIIEIAAIKKSQPAVDRASNFIPSWIHDLLNCTVELPAEIRRQLPLARKCLLQPLSVSPMLQAYAAFKPNDLNVMLRQHLKVRDVIVRSTAAELLAEQPPGEENTRALIEALPRALRDKDLNDAALAILDALGKQKSAAANEAIKKALDSSDHLIRRKAVALLKANGAGDFSNRIGYVQTRNTEADYRRAIARIGKRVTATVVTRKGAFTIELLPNEAPLTVDNFVMLARRGYFNGQTVPRVVPNFVIQTGDPRGDQNGGPGYSIRCEINEVPYDRAAVGMALSGKDTGGSQWFVTHSPQPHLDGGYTVFGRVVSGMEVVDRIARGDTIRRVVVNER
jgi:cyclophilin family peptidyl-prolyl cis-trans isomerase/HEAT repeat protein